jgi:hypothetical protein
MTVPGNHDYWVLGGPGVHYPQTLNATIARRYDQYGWGFSQYFAQDTIAARDAPSGFLHFESGGPDVIQDWSGINSNASNYFFYHTLGNLGFIGYSGGGLMTEQLPWLQEACLAMGAAHTESPLASVFLLGHWNSAHDYDGCHDAATPQVHTLLSTLPGCDAIGASRLKYMDGHVHCNHPGGAHPPTCPSMRLQQRNRVSDSGSLPVGGLDRLSI